MAYGQSGHLALCFQDSYGTSKINSPAFIPLVSESIQETIGQLVEGNIYSRFGEPPTHEGTHEIKGEIQTEAHPIALGNFFKSVLGGSNITAQGSAFQHVFVPAQTDWDDYSAGAPMTLEVHRDSGSAFVYSDMVADGVFLEVAQGQLLSAGVSLVGGRFSQKAASAPVYPMGRPWTWDVVSASYNALAVADFRSLSLRFDNHLSPQFTLSGDKHPHRVKRTAPQTLSVEGSLLFEDQTLFQAFRSQSENPMVIHFAGETIATSYQSALTVEIPRVRFGEFNPQLSGPGELEVKFSGKGIFDDTLGYAMKVTLVNTQSNY